MKETVQRVRQYITYLIETSTTYYNNTVMNKVDDINTWYNNSNSGSNMTTITDNITNYIQTTYRTIVANTTNDEVYRDMYEGIMFHVELFLLWILTNVGSWVVLFFATFTSSSSSVDPAAATATTTTTTVTEEEDKLIASKSITIAVNDESSLLLEASSAAASDAVKESSSSSSEVPPTSSSSSSITAVVSAHHHHHHAMRRRRRRIGIIADNYRVRD